MVWPAIIGAGATLLGGALAARSQKKIQSKQAETQREFAQDGIQWKVEDAKRAGIHPLYALGASTVSYAPSYVSGGDMGRAVSTAGQDISRAVSAALDKEGRETKKIGVSIAREELKSKVLDNQMKASQLAKMSQVGPAFPTATGQQPIIKGQGDGYPVSNVGSDVKPEPLRPVASAPGQPAKETGAVSDFTYVRTSSGGLSIVPSKDVKERIEDQIIPEMFWAFRNKLMPLMGMNIPPAPSTKRFPLPAGWYWKWNPFANEFRPVQKGSKIDKWFGKGGK
jgi:hypothetical protein